MNTIYVREPNKKNSRRKWHVDDGEREPFKTRKGERFYLITRCGKRMIDNEDNERTMDDPDDVCLRCSTSAPRGTPPFE